MGTAIQAFSIDGTTLTMDYEGSVDKGCIVTMDVSNFRGVMEVEFTPDADYAEFSRVIQEAAHRFTLGFEAANDWVEEDYPCDDDGMPTIVSMRLSALRDFGGDLHDLWDSPRFDSCGRIRSRRISATKERRGYRPWQSKKQSKKQAALLERLFN